MVSRMDLEARTPAAAIRSDGNQRSLVGRRSLTVNLQERKRHFFTFRKEKKNHLHSFIHLRLSLKEQKSIPLTEMFHRNVPEVSQLDPFVLQGCLEQRVVLKDVVICQDRGRRFVQSREEARKKERERKIAANNRSVAAYKWTVITRGGRGGGKREGGRLEPAT